MPIAIEVNLRVPDISVPAVNDAPARRITNSDMRFWKAIDVPALPKVDDDLELSTGTYVFHAIVKRLDWHEDKSCFVVTCRYARKSMDAKEYESLSSDPDWTMKSLIPGG